MSRASSLPHIGQLRRRFTLETAALSPDLAGGATRIWTASSTLWGAIEAVDARTDFAADRAGQVATHRIVIRPRAGIDGNARFRLGARVFTVLAVSEIDPQRRRVSCMVEETGP